MPPCARHAKKNLYRTRCTTSSRKAGRTLSDHYFPRYHHRHHETGAEAASRQTRTAYRSCIRVGIIKAKGVHKEGTRVPYRSATPCNQSYPCRTILYEKGYSIAQCGEEGLPPHTVEHRLPFGHDVVEGIWNGCSAYTLTGGNDSTVTSDASGSWDVVHGTRQSGFNYPGMTDPKACTFRPRRWYQY